jgi:hypothetical protein
MTTPFSSSLQDLFVCLNHPQIICWQPKMKGCILETSNSWNDPHTKTWCCILKHPTNGWPKNVPKMKTVYYKHPTHGYDQHDDQPTYPKLRSCTTNIQLMDIYRRIRRSVVQLHICLELGSVEWIVQLNDVQLQTWTWSLQNIAPKTKKS